MKETLLIGITGSIGSGKSVVNRFWSSYAGLPLIDVDLLCRELVEIDRSGWVALKENLGKSYFRTDGSLDRTALRSAIFADNDLRKKVDQLIHPLALELLKQKTANINQFVLVEVPLLFEAGWEDNFQSTVVVYADQQTCCERVTGRDGIDAEDAARAVVSQMGMWEKAMRADHVIDNRFGWLNTRMQIVHLAKVIVNMFEAQY